MLRCEAPASGLQRGAISTGCLGQHQNWRLSLLLLLLLVLLRVKMLLLVRLGSPTRLAAGVAGV